MARPGWGGYGNWTALLGARDAFEIAATVSFDGGRAATVVLWRDGEECGYQFWRRGRPIDGHVWNSPWEVLNADDTAHHLRAPEGYARTVAKRLRCRESEDALRALLGRRDSAEAVLREFVEVLDLPRQVLPLLHGRCAPAELPDVERVERLSEERAWQVRVRLALGPTGSRGHRILGSLGAAVTLLVSAVCVLMTAFEVAVVLTDGAFVDEPEALAEDWILILVFAALAGVLGWLGILLLRRVLGTR